MNPVYLSVIIPVYNEEERIIPALKDIVEYLSEKGITWEIIVAEDGSKDNTVARVQEFALNQKGIILLTDPVRRGKGYAVRQGMLKSNGKYVLFTDADLSAPISELDKLLFYLERGYDIAIGSRALRDSSVRVNFTRRIAGTVFNFIVRFLLLPDIVDTQCGFKCFRGDVAKELFSEQKMNGFSFDVEILYLARLKGYRIKQVPIRWYQSDSSRVDIFRDSLKMFKDVLEIRKRCKCGGKV